MRKVWMLVLAAVAGGALLAKAEAPGGPATRGARPWEQTLRALRSEDFGERQRGQRELDQATWRDRDTLHQLAAAASDEEVKQRLAQRVDALDEQMALDPPPISLDLSDAPLSTVAAELSRVLQMPLAAADVPGRKYTLHAAERPFADVYLALAAQGGFTPDFSGRRLQNASRELRGAVRSGPFLVCPLGLTPSADDAVGGGTGGAASRTMTLSYTIIADPRVRILNSTVPLITSVIDDQGDELIPPPLPNAPPPDRIMVGNVRGSWEYTYLVDVEVPAGVKKIVSVKGDGLYTAEAAKIAVEVADVQQQGHTSIVVGDREVVYDSFTLAEGARRFSARVLQPAAPAAAGPNLPTDRAVTIKLMDATGRVLTLDHIAGGYGGMVTGKIVAPIRGMLSVPIKTADLAVPFELKDIAVPGAEPATRP